MRSGVVWIPLSLCLTVVGAAFANVGTQSPAGTAVSESQISAFRSLPAHADGVTETRDGRKIFKGNVTIALSESVLVVVQADEATWDETTHEWVAKGTIRVKSSSTH